MRPLLAIVIAAGLLVAWMPRDRPASTQVRGVGLGLFASDPAYDYGTLVDEIASRGATDLLLVLQWRQANTWAVDVGPGPSTATGETLQRTIEQAHRHGLRVTLMPIVRLDERTQSQWRGNIMPDAEMWFAAYRTHLVDLARHAESARVERLVVGSELGSLQPHEATWRNLLRDVRAVYGGTVAYSANWDNFENVPFWDAVDEVGVTGYFPVDADDPASSWRVVRERLAALEEATGKPVILTEVGYPSHRRAAERPWDQLADHQPAPALQAQLYRAFCDAAAPTVDGYFFWNWFGFGGPGEVSFTPRGKPAAAELERCMRRD